MFVVADAHSTGKMRPGGDAALEARHQLLLRERAGVEELLHQRVVGFGDHLDQRLARAVGRAFHLRRHRPFGGLAAAVGGVGPRLHGDQIDDAAEALFLADRQLNRDDRAAEHAAQRLDGAIQAGALAVEAVEDDEPRHLQLLGAAPHLLGRHLDAGHRIDDDDGGIGDAQRRARVAQEVGHARRVDEVDFDLVPLGVGECSGEGVLAGNLFFVVIRHRRPVVYPSKSVHRAGIEQQGGDELCLAGAAMADEGHISQRLSVVDLHERSPPKAVSCQLPADQLPVASFQLSSAVR